jgi:uncharacterized membrane protein YphA (DoxX/SURF4 family)
MKARKITYWVTTGLLAAVFAFGGVMDVLSPPQVAEQLAHLGYPTYFAPLIGVWKVLGVVALLAPGFPLIKEWAYAGMVFDLTGATVSHAAVGDPIANVVTPIVFLALLVASWWLRPASRRLTTPAGAVDPHPGQAPVLSRA